MDAFDRSLLTAAAHAETDELLSASYTLASIQAVKLSRVGLKNVFDRGGCNPLIVAQQMNGIELG